MRLHAHMPTLSCGQLPEAAMAVQPPKPSAAEPMHSSMLMDDDLEDDVMMLDTEPAAPPQPERKPKATLDLLKEVRCLAVKLCL